VEQLYTVKEKRQEESAFPSYKPRVVRNEN